MTGTDYWLRINATAQNVQNAMNKLGQSVNKTGGKIQTFSRRSVAAFKRLVTSIKKAYQENERFQRAVQKLGQTARRLMYVLIALAGVSIKFARDQEFAEMRINAVTKAMGMLYADGKRISAQWVKDFAKARESVTTFTDEVTLNGAAMLTTFAGLTTHHLPKAIKIMQDMGALTGSFGDLRMAGMQLGRAIDGLYAGLRRIGVSVTQAEVDTMTAAKDLGLQFEANTMLLGIMESQIGGMAEAINKGPLAAFDRLRMSAKTALEEMGEIIAKNLNEPLREASGLISDIAIILQAKALRTQATRRKERVSTGVATNLAEAGLQILRGSKWRMGGPMGAVLDEFGMWLDAASEKLGKDAEEARRYIEQQKKLVPLAEILGLNDFLALAQKVKLAATEAWVEQRVAAEEQRKAAAEAARLLAGAVATRGPELGLKGKVAEAARMGRGDAPELQAGWRKRYRLPGMGVAFTAEDMEPESAVTKVVDRVFDLQAAIAVVARQWYQDLPAAAKNLLAAIDQVASTFAGAFADAFFGIKVNFEKLIQDMLKMAVKSGIMAFFNKLLYGAFTGVSGFAGGGILGTIAGFVGLGGGGPEKATGAGGAGGPGQGYAGAGIAAGNLIKLQWVPTGITNRGHVRYWYGAEEGVLSDRRDQITNNTPTDYAEVI